MLASALRCYEDGRWPLRSWDGCGPSSQALRRKAEKRLERGWAACAGLYLFLVQVRANLEWNRIREADG